MLNGDYYDDNGDGYDEKSIHNCQRLSFACAHYHGSHIHIYSISPNGIFFVPENENIE